MYTPYYTQCFTPQIFTRLKVLWRYNILVSFIRYTILVCQVVCFIRYTILDCQVKNFQRCANRFIIYEMALFGWFLGTWSHEYGQTSPEIVISQKKKCLNNLSKNSIFTETGQTQRLLFRSSFNLPLPTDTHTPLSWICWTHKKFGPFPFHFCGQWVEM